MFCAVFPRHLRRGIYKVPGPEQRPAAVNWRLLSQRSPWGRPELAGQGRTGRHLHGPVGMLFFKFVVVHEPCPFLERVSRFKRAIVFVYGFRKSEGGWCFLLKEFEAENFSLSGCCSWHLAERTVELLVTDAPTLV